MLVSLLRALAFAAFAVLGVVWSSDQTDTLATLWAVSFGLVVVLALWDMRPDLGAAWDALPGPSKNPDDYR